MAHSSSASCLEVQNKGASIRNQLRSEIWNELFCALYIKLKYVPTWKLIVLINFSFTRRQNTWKRFSLPFTGWKNGTAKGSEFLFQLFRSAIYQWILIVRYQIQICYHFPSLPPPDWRSRATKRAEYYLKAIEELFINLF